MHSEFMAFVTDDGSVSLLREWAERQGFPAATVQNGGAELFASMLESDAPPKLVFVDMDHEMQPAQTVARLANLCGLGTKIIALGSANDVSLYRGMLASGAADYLVKPLSHEMLGQAMALALRGNGPATPDVKEGKIIVVMGVRGGVGASTVAVNTGWLIAHKMKKSVALLDLDLQFGTTALALDLQPGRGLRDIISSPQRVDSLMVASAMTNESDDFAILSAEESVEDVFVPDSSAVGTLIKEMRPNFHFILVDLPRTSFATQKRLLATAHEIVLITEMSLAGIRDTLRLRMALKALGCTARITLAAAPRSAAVDEASFTKGAQAKIDFTLPDDPKSVIAASNAGKMLGDTAPNAPLTTTLLLLAQHLTGASGEEGGKKGWLDGLFGGKKPSPKTGVRS